MTAVDNPQSATRNTQPAETIVAVRGLTKIFKDFWGRPKAKAVDNVDFEVRRGEVFGLLGPNGSGKSTTVKLLLGLLYPTKGHIEVFGHSSRHVATKSRIGYLPEESYLYRYLNSHETLDFFGNLFRLPRSDRDNRAEQLLEMVGLSQTRTRAVGEFSKGMQRRIGLAQALINDPDLVILDEPTSGLDPIGCREVKDLILALARRGKTVILSSHLLADVEDVCDRVVIYYGGKIHAMGTLKDLLAKPDSIRITAPVLSRQTLERVLETIRRDVSEDKIRIDTRRMQKFFEGLQHPARGQMAVTSGFSWPGFFLTCIWAFVSRLWFVGAVLLAVYLVLAVIAFGVFKGDALVCAILSLACPFVTGLQGNTWKSKTLERRAYHYLYTVPANSPAAAMAKLQQASGVIPPEWRTRLPSTAL